jgi:hypothetical protein
MTTSRLRGADLARFQEARFWIVTELATRSSEQKIIVNVPSSRRRAILATALFAGQLKKPESSGTR